MLFLLFGSTMSAQCNAPIVATECVGACGSPSEINYTSATPCFVKAKKYCVVNESSSLCGNTGVYAIVLVNGNYVTSGNITSVGASLDFWAKCGSDIKVIATTFYKGGVICVWLGELNYSLREQ